MGTRGDPADRWGKYYPPSAIGAYTELCRVLPMSGPQPSLESTMHLNKKLECELLSMGQMLLGWMPGHEIKNQVSAKKGKETKLSNPAAVYIHIETARVEDRGTAASPDREALARERLQGSREGRGSWHQTWFPSAAIANHAHGQEPNLAQIDPKVPADGHGGTLIPQSFCPDKRSRCMSCRTCAATGNWC